MRFRRARLGVDSFGTANAAARSHDLSHRARAPHQRTRVLVMACVAVAGCSMMQPYDREEPVAFGPEHGLELAGNANDGLAAAEALRAQYFTDLRASALTRNGTALVAAGLSGWALYAGLEPTAVNGGTPTHRDKVTTLRLGVVLATLYGLRQFFVSPDQESIYAEGYRSLTCLMLASTPLLMTQSIEPPSSSSKFKLSASSPESALPPAFDAPAGGDLDRFQLVLDKLEAAILAVNLERADEEAAADRIADGDTGVIGNQADLRKQIAMTDKALAYARHALSDGRTLVQTVKGAGREIQYRVGIVASTVNTEVQAKQHDLDKAGNMLKNAQDITTGVLNIGNATAADQTVVSQSDAATVALSQPAKRRPILLSGPMSAAWGPLFGGALATATSASTSAPGSGASAGAVAPSASAPSGASRSSKAKPKPKAAASSASEPITSAELQTVRDRIDDAIKAANTREAAADAQKQKAQAQAQIDKLTALEKNINSHLTCGTAVGPAACAGHLARMTEMLYAARRPVAQELLNFRHKTRDVANIPECAELAVLRVTPNDVHRALAGETVTYIVSQRAAGSPLAVLQGPLGGKAGATLTFAPLQGTTLYTAKVEIGDQMPQQAIELDISDSQDIAHQALPIVAGGARPKPLDPPASAASSPDGSDKKGGKADAATPAASSASNAASNAAGDKTPAPKKHPMKKIVGT